MHVNELRNGDKYVSMRLGGGVADAGAAVCQSFGRCSVAGFSGFGTGFFFFCIYVIASARQLHRLVNVFANCVCENNFYTEK